MQKKKNIILDRLLLIGVAFLVLIVVGSIYLPLKLVFKLSDTWTNFTVTSITLLGVSIFGVYSFIKEEKIKKRKPVFILIALSFYFIYTTFIIIIDRFGLIPLDYLFGRTYRRWLIGMLYIALLLFSLVYIAEKLEKK